MSGTINLDPPEDFLDARNLNTLIERWLATVSVAENTRTTMRGKMAHFTRWWEAVGPTVEWRLTQSLMEDFEAHLRSIITERFGEPMSYTMRRSIVRTVSSMFKWAAEKNKTTKHYGVWLPSPTGSMPKRKSATPEQLVRLMAAAAESKYPLRDQTIIAFFIGTGCRLSEVAGLRAEDLTILADGAGTVVVTGKRTKANESGIHAVAFPASTGKLLVKYMDETRITKGPLWLSQHGEQIKAQAIYHIVKRAIESARLYDHIQGPHDLRRAFATILSRMHPAAPGWADMIRRQLGHANYAMTSHYILLDADDIQLPSPLEHGQGEVTR